MYGKLTEGSKATAWALKTAGTKTCASISARPTEKGTKDTEALARRGRARESTQDCSKVRVALEEKRASRQSEEGRVGVGVLHLSAGTRKRPHERRRPQTLPGPHVAGPEALTTEGSAGRAAPRLGRPGGRLSLELRTGSCCFSRTPRTGRPADGRPAATGRAGTAPTSRGNRFSSRYSHLPDFLLYLVMMK